ncbi:MAG: electron transfer flavoprotein subunit beta/FixA family protein [Acidimicrobiia bacterium]
MKIAVCVKHVPVGRVRMLPDTLRLERTGPGELNSFDKHAIEAALRLAESDGADTGGAETVVVSVGPPEAEESLRTALAMGIDRAVLVSDPAAVGSDLIGTAKLLGAALTRETPDLALFGQQASDGGGAVLWAAVADLLQQPFVSQASTLTVRDGTVVVSRETEYGNDEIEAPLPALVAVSDAINEPRYTSLKGRMAAKKKPLDVLAVADVGADAAGVGAAGAKTTVVAVAAPPSRGTTVRIDDEAGAPEAIVAFLAERELV